MKTTTLCLSWLWTLGLYDAVVSHVIWWTPVHVVEGSFSLTIANARILNTVHLPYHLVDISDWKRQLFRAEDSEWPYSEQYPSSLSSGRVLQRKRSISAFRDGECEVFERSLVSTSSRWTLWEGTDRSSSLKIRNVPQLKNVQSLHHVTHISSQNEV